MPDVKASDYFSVWGAEQQQQQQQQLVVLTFLFACTMHFCHDIVYAEIEEYKKTRNYKFRVIVSSVLYLIHIFACSGFRSIHARRFFHCQFIGPQKHPTKCARPALLSVAICFIRLGSIPFEVYIC